jgi:hypothetical protein
MSDDDPSDDLSAGNVSSLGTHRALKKHDNRLWTPTECLIDCLEDIKSGKTPCDKLLILRIKTADDEFAVGHNCANIKGSEILAALEICKIQILIDMGY